MQIQNVTDATIDSERVSNFATGVKVLADNSGVAYSKFHFVVDKAKTALVISVRGPNGWANCNTCDSVRLDATDTLISIDPANSNQYAQGWKWRDCSFEPNGQPAFLSANQDVLDWLFDAPWIEGKPLAVNVGSGSRITFRRGGGTLAPLVLSSLPPGVVVTN